MVTANPFRNYVDEETRRRRAALGLPPLPDEEELEREEFIRAQIQSQLRPGAPSRPSDPYARPSDVTGPQMARRDLTREQLIAQMDAEAAAEAERLKPLMPAPGIDPRKLPEVALALTFPEATLLSGIGRNVGGEGALGTALEFAAGAAVPAQGVSSAITQGLTRKGVTTAVELAALSAGGAVAGEQLGGETGRLIGGIAAPVVGGVARGAVQAARRPEPVVRGVVRGRNVELPVGQIKASDKELDELGDLYIRRAEIIENELPGAQAQAASLRETASPIKRVPGWMRGHSDNELKALAKQEGIPEGQLYSNEDWADRIDSQVLADFKAGRFRNANESASRKARGRQLAGLRGELAATEKRIAAIEASEPFTGRPPDTGLQAGMGVGEQPAQGTLGVGRAGPDISPPLIDLENAQAQAARRAAVASGQAEMPVPAAVRPPPSTLAAGGTQPPPPAASRPPIVSPNLLPAAPATVAPPVLTPVERLTEFLNKTPPLRRATEVERSKEMARRAGRVAERLQDVNAPPQRALARATGELSGELPKQPLPTIGRFEGGQVIPATDLFSQDDVDSFFRTVQTTGVLRPLEKIAAKDGLQRAFLGDLPQPSQLALLERVFGAEFTRALARHMKRGTWDTVIDAINLPRSAFQTVLDFGAFLRQGAVLVPSRPIRASKSAARALRAFGDDKYATKVATVREADPDYLRFTRNPVGKERLYVAPLKGAVTPTAREEVFISDLANRIPVIKQIVGASSRIHNTFLNELRYGVMKDIVRSWEKTGRAASDQELDILARHLNYASGRGSLGPLNKFSRELSAALYSPRFLISRLQVPLPTLEAAIKREPRVLRETARDLVAFIGTGMTIATLLNKTKAADVETDARSPAFGRARIGNTTWDYWGGFQPLARYTWQAISGQSKNVTTGKVSKIQGGPLTGKPDETILWRFLRTKLAPGPGLAIDVRAGKSVSGKKLEADLSTVEETAKNNLLPLFIQDMLEVAQEEGWPVAAAGAVPSALGVGVTTFTDTEKAAPKKSGLGPFGY